MKDMKTTKRKNFADGLAYDNQRNQFYTITYIWDYIVDELQDTNYRDVKSGITGLGIDHAMRVSTRGKNYPQNKIWEHRKYIPKYATLEQANKIVLHMDNSFKYTVENQLYFSKRKLTNDNTIGTEWYRIPTMGGIQTIKETWLDSFNDACFIVLRDSSGFEPNDYEISGAWSENLEVINKYFEIHSKGRFIATTGYGKGFLAWITAYLSKRGKQTHIKVYYANNISNTKQLVHAHNEKYEQGNGNDTKVVVCSNHKKVKTKYTDIDVYSAGNGHLKSIIKSTMKYGNEVSFYVNRHSADIFNTTFNKLADELNYTKEVSVIVDEIQEFTGDIFLNTTKAITNPIKNSWMMGMTATEERRDPSDTRTSVIKNDDVEYFGNIIYEVMAHEAILLGRHCPIDFHSLIMGNGCDLTKVVAKNKIIKVQLKTKESLVRGKLMRALSSVDYSINKCNKTKIIFLTSLIVDADSAVHMLETMKQEGIIPSDYLIVNGKNDNKIEGPKQFEKAKKAIFVCTPWSITGLDIPSADCAIATYDFGKNRVARQWIGRVTRVPDNNPNKRALIIIPLDYYDSNPNNLPTLMFVKEDMVKNINTHSIQVPKNTIQYNVVNGSRVQKLVTHQVFRGQMGSSTEPDLESDWDVVMNASNNLELSSLDITRLNIGKVEQMIDKYKTLSELHQHNEQLFNSLHRYESELGLAVYGKFSDYTELSNSEEDIANQLTKQFKSYSEIPPSILKVVQTKVRHLYMVKDNNLVTL